MTERKEASQRQKAGQKIGFISLLTNLLLFVGKLSVGLVSNSIAVMADAFNNLADCVSSLVGILGFRYAARRDRNHPFGHGRIEYVSGMVVSIIIMMTAVSVGEAAVDRLLNPEEVNTTIIPIVVCIAAIAIKIGLFFFEKHASKRVKSQTLNAMARDRLSDALATFIALLSLVLAPHTDFPLDGLLGMVVAVFILYSGAKSFWDNLELVLGKGLSAKEMREIREILASFAIVEYATDLDLHDYGPEARILLAKVHLAADPETKEFKNEMMKIKRELNRAFGFNETIIYWPPLPDKKP
ncbi:MAG: cation diffusion facilitator family transporter [Candidatus Nomurabacteria bacterium]|jgi:cation diffusion facilitator family transporter|nr:cation diffusion facilitator family transporter [Candidatus Nomurabacteria bacterium]